MEQYKAITVVDSDGVSHSMKEVQYETAIGPVMHQRSYMCRICGFVFKKDKIKLINGSPYCVPNECYLEGQDK